MKVFLLKVSLKMPKIRNLRIINAQFNEATREFQDLRMPFYGESATYELINGGGKSVLLMLLMQCVTPNSSLDHKKPLKDIFRGGNSNRTTHVLVEWELDEGLYEHKYLLTGFCAKKKNNPDDLDKNGAPDYFNYIYLYDGSNDFDIHRIPLCRYEDDVFVSIDISKTRDLLRENCEKYDIWIAESKRDYIEMIKKFNLLEVEMDLIRHINKKENYLKSHFTENYGTSRSLIEKLLDTTERCLKSKKSIYNDELIESSNESLASALYQSQKDIKRLKEEMEKLEEYEKLDKEVRIIASANNEVIEKFSRLEDTKKQAACQIQTYKTKISEKKAELDKTNAELEHARHQHAKTEMDIERLEIMRLNATVNIGKKELEILGNEKKTIQDRIRKLDSDINFAVATNKYLKILELEEQIQKDKATLKNTEKEHEELFEKRNVLGQKLRSCLKKEYDLVKGQFDDESDKLKIIRDEFNKHQEYIWEIKSARGQKQSDLSRLKNQNEELSKKEAKLQNQYMAFPKITGGMILKDEIVATVDRRRELNERAEKLVDYIHQEKNNLINAKGESKITLSEIEHVKEKLESAKKSFSNFGSQKETVLKVLSARASESLQLCLKQIEDERKATSKQVLSLEQKKEILRQEIDTISEHGYSLTEDMKNSLKWFRSELGFAKTGSEYLKDLKEEKQKEILGNAPWLTKSIILTRQDFNRIVNNPASILPASIMDSTVIITNQSSLQEQKKLSLGDIFLPSRDAEHYIKILDPETTIKQIKTDIGIVEKDFSRYNTTLGIANDDRDTIKLYIDKYPADFESEIQREISIYKESIEKYKIQLASVLESITKIEATLEQKSLEKENILAEIDSLNERIDVFKELDEVIDTCEKLELSLKEYESNIKELDVKYLQANEQKSQLERESQEKESFVTGLRDQLKEIERDLKPLESFSIVDIESLHEEEIKNLQPEFDSLNDVIARVAGDASSLEKSIKDNNDFVNDLWGDIQRNKISKEALLSSERKVPYSNEYIEQLETDKEAAESSLSEFEETFKSKNEQQIRLVKGFEDKVISFNQRSIESYIPDDTLLDNAIYDTNIKEKKDERIRLSEHVDKLDSLHMKFEGELHKFQDNHDHYRDLDSFYQFSGFEAVVVEELIDYNKMSYLLKDSSEKVDESKNNYESLKGKSIETIRNLKVPMYFIDTIKDKLKNPGSLREAELISRSLNDYLMIIESKTKVQKELVDSLKHVEEKVVSQALGIAMIYKDYLKRFPSLSRIILDGRSTDMIRINFDDCEYTDDMAMSEMKRYIQQLIEDIESQKITQKELVDYLTPVHLINKVLDMKNISLSIRKIDTTDTKFQKWERIQASDGQENAMFIIFMVVLMSYIRDIVVDRKDKNTSKVLIIDNPFGSTSACYLWEKISAILEKNNVQIICPGHKISPSVSEYFPVRHILTEEASTDGRVRVNVKTSAKDEIMDKIEQQKRYGQLKFEI